MAKGAGPRGSESNVAASADSKDLKDFKDLKDPLSTLNSTLNRQYPQHVDELGVDGFVLLDGLVEGDVHYLVVLHAYHHVALSLLQCLDGSHAQAACQDAVDSRGRSSALQVAEDGHADVILRILRAHPVGIVHRSSCLRAFRDEHDAAVLALADAAPDELLQLVDARLILRDDGSLGACGDGAVEAEEPCVAPHHLDEEDAVVRGSRVANLVHSAHDGVQRRVVADGVVRAVEVVVNGAGQPYAGHVVFVRKLQRSRQRAVAADDDEGVDVVLPEVLVRLLPSLHRAELLAARRLQDGTSALDDVAHALGGEVADLVVDESLESAVDALHLPSLVDGCSCDGSDGTVHAWGVSSRCEHADGVYLSHSLCSDNFFRSAKVRPLAGFSKKNDTLFQYFFPPCVKRLIQPLPVAALFPLAEAGVFA